MIQKSLALVVQRIGYFLAEEMTQVRFLPRAHSTWSYYCSIYRGESETLTVWLCGGWTPSEHVSTKEVRSVTVTGVWVPVDIVLTYGTGIALPPWLTAHESM